MIHLESNFVQFKEKLLPKEGNKALLTFPFLHIYWTECCVSTGWGTKPIQWKCDIMIGVWGCAVLVLYRLHFSDRWCYPGESLTIAWL